MTIVLDFNTQEKTDQIFSDFVNKTKMEMKECRIVFKDVSTEMAKEIQELFLKHRWIVSYHCHRYYEKY